MRQHIYTKHLPRRFIQSHMSGSGIRWGQPHFLSPEKSVEKMLTGNMSGTGAKKKIMPLKFRL